jgi:hypothetical protein
MIDIIEYLTWYIALGGVVLSLMQYMFQPIWAQPIWRYLVRLGAAGFFVMLAWPILVVTALIGIFQILKKKD